MEGNNTRESDTRKKSLEQIMRERGNLDRMLEKDFRKRMTILFSDISGYTQYMETVGDIEGSAWVQKHHDIVLPLIEEYGGDVLDIMGDGIMGAFLSSLSAVKAAIAIQNSLHEHNASAHTNQRIHVRIGINTGLLLVDGKNVSGDVVNVASRIENLARPDEILLSRSAYEDVRGSEDVLCRVHGTFPVKGKREPLELYRVIWQDEDIVLSAEPRIRAAGGEPAPETGHKPAKVFQLEITREKEGLAVSAYEESAGEATTVRHYDKVRVSVEKIGSRSRELYETLNRVNRDGRISREILSKLKGAGQRLTDELITPAVKKNLAGSEADHLILNVDDRLVHIPWELLHDGNRFLCQRFSMGRLVKTRQPILALGNRKLARPLKMLILADPGGDLKGAYQEGLEIRDQIDKDREAIAVSLLSGNITAGFIKEKMRNFDLVHFAGHAEYDLVSPEQSGWRLSRGTIRAGEISRMAGTAAMPALIFSNACQSARTEEWVIKEEFENKIYGLANAFILAGVKHYIGTFWEILDEPSRDFALEFYRGLLAGGSVGEAVRDGRQHLIDKYGEETIVWASYVLYGDPASNYMEQVRASEQERPRKPGPAGALAPEGHVRAKDDLIDLSEEAPRKRKTARWAALAAAVLLAVLLLWGWPGPLRDSARQFRDQALAAYEKGDFDQTLKTCGDLENRDPNIGLVHLLRGHIHLRRGDLEMAEAAYNNALEAEKISAQETAEALTGLGRIASIRGRPEAAIDYYRQSTRADAQYSGGYLAQALFMEQQGEYEKALNLMGKARALDPEDETLQAISKQTEARVVFSRDQERQERVDRLIEDLLQGTGAESEATQPEDAWTSRPLTLFLLDPESAGYTLQEGQGRLLAAGITEHLSGAARVRVVERALLDRLLEELKLGTSRLADQNTVLSIGKLLAARLMVTCQMVHSGPQSQVSMRVIETETGSIEIAISESFERPVPASEMSRRLSDRLLRELPERYPLRGRISAVAGVNLSLNIGANLGVEMGQRFRVIETQNVLEVTEVKADSSVCRILEGKGPMSSGLRAEELREV